VAITSAVVLLAALTLSGCLSPRKKLARQMPELRRQWQTNVAHQAELAQRSVDWPQAVSFLRDHSLKLRRARVEVTNAQENLRQVFKDLLPQINIHSGINQTLGDIPMTSWNDLFLDVNGFFNVPGFISLDARYFGAKLSLIRAKTLSELVEREQTIELYKLMLAFQEHAETKAALDAEQRFASAVRTVDDVTGQVLLRQSEKRELALRRGADDLQQRAGDLLGEKGWRWIITTNGAPGLEYATDPLPMDDTNRIAQLQMRLVALELVGAWARIVGIKLQYWPEVRLFVTGPPIYTRRAGSETFFDADQIRLTADVFWQLDIRGQIARQLRQTRREQELQIEQVRQQSIALIDRLLSAQKLVNDLRNEIAELDQVIPVVEALPPAAEFTSIVKAAETRSSLRDEERRLRRELAELNTLFWFVDEQKWNQREKLF
jgi:hypothetical protein